MEKKKRERKKRFLTSAQEIIYGREFKKADRAGGFSSKN